MLNYEYQLDVLRYLARTKEKKVLFMELEKEIVSTNDLQFLFNLAQSYIKKYKVTPKENSLKQFFADNLAKNPKEYDTNSVNFANELITKLYEPINSDAVELSERIDNFAKRQLFRNLLIEYSDKTENLTDEDLLKISSKVNKLYNIGKESEQLVPGEFLFKDLNFDRPAGVNAIPFFLKGINELTAAKGFYSPQIVIFAAPPKGFKTGLMLNAALDFATIHGKKVLYCDTENGIQPLKDRALQGLVNITFQELVSEMYNERIASFADMTVKQGGEIRIEYFASGTSTIDDVEQRIIDLKEIDFVPDIIIYDYFDNFKSTDNSLKQEHLQIQDIYKHALRLNVKYETFCLSVTQVGRQALNKLFISGSDLAKDFGKAANAHALFAICGVKWEEQNGIRHIIPLFQRQGKKHFIGKNEVFIRLDEERMSIEELDEIEADKIRGIIGLSSDEFETDNDIPVNF